MTDFEIFRKSLVALRRDPTVTVQKRGTISLNKAAETLLGSPRAVELLFDAAARIVGFRAVDPRAAHAYPLRSSTGKENGPFVISAMAFLHFYGIQPPNTLRWPAFITDDALCIDLRSPATPVSSNRARKRTLELDGHGPATSVDGRQGQQSSITAETGTG